MDHVFTACVSVTLCEAGTENARGMFQDCLEADGASTFWYTV